MLKLAINPQTEKPLKVLFLGAHSDDIEIGCGGTALQLIAQYPDMQATWVVFGARGKRSIEAQASADAFLSALKEKRILLKEFRDGFFPYIGGEIKDFFEQLKREESPDIILTHYRHDLHQDHRLICELTWNTFRDQFILEYEIPKYDGDLGVPNFFVHLDEPVYRRKISLLMSHFDTQADKDWFSEDTFTSMMRLRGMESRSPSKFAEAFYSRKVTL